MVLEASKRLRDVIFDILIEIRTLTELALQLESIKKSKGAFGPVEIDYIILMIRKVMRTLDISTNKLLVLAEEIK